MVGTKEGERIWGLAGMRKMQHIEDRECTVHKLNLAFAVFGGRRHLHPGCPGPSIPSRNFGENYLSIPVQ